MSKASNISSLSELRDRREEIKTEQEAARRGLTSSLASAPSKAKEYALEDLALPALGIGLAAYVAYRVLRSDEMPQQQQQQVNPAPQPQGPRPQEGPVARPAPRAAAAQPVRPVQEARGTRQEVTKSSFDFGSILTVGKLLIPAAQAIVGVIQQAKEQTKE